VSVSILGVFGSTSGFFHSSTWYVLRNLAIFFVLVFWVATVYWVYKDARRRIEDKLAVWVSTVLGIVPFVGPIIYMLFRPPEYLEDVRERDLEMAAAEARLAQLSYFACEHCGTEVEKDYLICPSCHARLRESCDNCHRALEMNWTLCPYCEAPAVGTRSRRRREAFVAGEMPPAP
jgi:RNA polymerase subunit RPABC4/transcription elongation factor Spt4